MLRHGLPAVQPYPYVALWGRSAGAAAALEQAAKDPTLAAIVCDSAYSDLASLLEMPGLLSAPLAGLCQLASGSGLLGPGVDSSITPPSDHARSCFAPALFLHPAEDEILSAEHARALRQAYGGEAQLLTMSATSHDSARPSEAIARAALFLARAFGLEQDSVSRLALYLSRLHPDASTEKIDREAAELLAAQESRKRCWGLLMKAVNACPAYHGAAFSRVKARGLRPSSRGQEYVKFAVLVTLPSASSEVCIAWAAERPSGQECQKPCLGTVHFANISCSCLNLARASVIAGMQKVEWEDLAVQDTCKLHKGIQFVPNQMKLSSQEGSATNRASPGGVEPHTPREALYHAVGAGGPSACSDAPSLQRPVCVPSCAQPKDTGRIEIKLGKCSLQWGRLNQEHQHVVALSHCPVSPVL